MTITVLRNMGAASLLLGLALLAGCSTFRPGNSEYACPGLPDGVRCQSAREVYDMTSQGGAAGSIDAASERLSASPVASQSQQGTALNSHPAVPTARRTAPLRTPARVMRIWIAPWEDEQGDLNLPGYVFTEIEPRRWEVGVRAPPHPAPVLRPLQTQGEPPEAKANGQRQGASIYGEISK